MGEPIDITLHKAKYRDPHRRGPLGQKATSRTGNSHGPTPKHRASGLRSRKKAYGPF